MIIEKNEYFNKIDGLEINYRWKMLLKDNFRKDEAKSLENNWNWLKKPKMRSKSEYAIKFLERYGAATCRTITEFFLISNTDYDLEDSPLFDTQRKQFYKVLASLEQTEIFDSVLLDPEKNGRMTSKAFISHFITEEQLKKAQKMYANLGGGLSQKKKKKKDPNAYNMATKKFWAQKREQESIEKAKAKKESIEKAEAEKESIEKAKVEETTREGYRVCMECGIKVKTNQNTKITETKCNSPYCNHKRRKFVLATSDTAWKLHIRRKERQFWESKPS